MALGTLALQQIEAKLPKVISPKTHGLIDYCHAGFFATMAVVCWNTNRKAAVAAAGTSALVLVQSLLTDYRWGAGKVIPFEVHGQMDGSFAALSFGIPRAFGFEGTGPAKIFEANAVVEAAIVGLTDWNNQRAHAGE